MTDPGTNLPESELTDGAPVPLVAEIGTPMEEGVETDGRAAASGSHSYVVLRAWVAAALCATAFAHGWRTGASRSQSRAVSGAVTELTRPGPTNR